MDLFGTTHHSFLDKIKTIPERNVTKIEYCEEKNIWIKRDDTFVVCDSIGAKARACFYLIEQAKNEGFTGVTTAGSRQSPQINIVSTIARYLGLRCVCHCPKGELGLELLDAQKQGAEIIQHKAGYNSVIKARSITYAQENKGFKDIPFGMMCEEAVLQTASQVTEIPQGVERIVIVVGSGMNLCGLLWGLKKLRSTGVRIPHVLGIVVGANPIKALEKFAPKDWNTMCELEMAGIDYHDEVNERINGFLLDPVYEAKCVKFLKPKDLFWVIGIRKTLFNKDKKFKLD